jgi:predicted amidohydrolase
VEANVEQHLALIRTAAAEAPNAIVFPELSLTGYELEQSAALAFEIDDTRLSPLREAAKDCKVTLVVGAPIQLGEHLFNGAFILSPAGETLVHCKRFLGTFSEEARVDGHLPPPEPSVFEPGDQAAVFPLPEGLAAVAICAEANRPEHAMDAASRAAKFYLAGSFVIPSEYLSATQNLSQRARDHQMLVAFANFGGASGGMRSAGGSAIWAPGGDLLCRLPDRDSGALVAVHSRGSWTGFEL